MTGTAASTTVLAHGLSLREDLPIPLDQALLAGVVALLASFVVLGVAWRRPMFDAVAAGQPLPVRIGAILRAPSLDSLLRAAGGVLAILFVASLLLVPNGPGNPAISAFYVVLWVGVPLASVAVGPLWRRLNPLRTVYLLVVRASRGAPDRAARPYPRALGYWPAALALFSFTWLELVAPDRDSVAVIGLYVGIYTVVMLAGAAVFGSTWFDHADGFEVFSALMARLALVGRRGDGRLAFRNPLDGLDGVPVGPGVHGVVLTLFGSTAFDGLSATPFWQWDIPSGAVPPVLLNTLGLVGMVLLVMGTYQIGVRLSARLAGAGPGMPAQFAHSVVPIALGYLIAHYYSFLILGTRLAFQLSTATLFGSGRPSGGTPPGPFAQSLVGATLVSHIQVASIVLGHVLGVIAAHDRAVRLFPPGRAVAGQLPLLVLMVGYTVGGLCLLYAG